MSAPLQRADARQAWRAFFRERGAGFGVAVIFLTFFCGAAANLIAPHDPAFQYRDHLLQPPVWSVGGSTSFVLGTDELGRDLLSRLLYGARLSLAIASMSVLLSVLPGIAFGLLAAFHKRTVAPVILRAMDVLMALPGLLVAICVIAVLGPGLTNTMIAVAVGTLPGHVRLVRAAALTELPKDYVLASRIAGAGTFRLMWRTVLPNCLPPVIVNATLGFSSAILDVAALGFLGLGVQAPTPEWGTMLSSARDYFHLAPWIVIAPGLAILVSVLAINLVGDALRDVLDPKLRGAE